MADKYITQNTDTTKIENKQSKLKNTIKHIIIIGLTAIMVSFDISAGANFLINSPLFNKPDNNLTYYNKVIKIPSQFSINHASLSNANNQIDTQEVLTFTKNSKKISVILKKVKTENKREYFLLNGLTNNNRWYQEDVEYTKNNKFEFSVEPWTSKDTSLPILNSYFSGPVNKNDNILMKMSIENNKINLTANDLNTGSSAKLVLPASGAKYFRGLQRNSNKQGYSTGLMSEVYLKNKAQAEGFKPQEYLLQGKEKKEQVILSNDQFKIINNQTETLTNQASPHIDSLTKFYIVNQYAKYIRARSEILHLKNGGRAFITLTGGTRYQVHKMNNLINQNIRYNNF